MRKLLTFVLLPLALSQLTACDSQAERDAKQLAVAQADIARSDSVARAAAADPHTGLWTEANLTERLVRTGMAPRRVLDARPGPGYMQADRLLFLAGGGEVHAWIYADSIARRAVSETLNPRTATPPGASILYDTPVTLVTNNNVIVVFSGGRDINHERIQLAVEAGQPVANTP